MGYISEDEIADWQRRDDAAKELALICCGADGFVRFGAYEADAYSVLAVLSYLGYDVPDDHDAQRAFEVAIVQWAHATRNCPQCEGYGRVDRWTIHNRPCKWCRGSGLRSTSAPHKPDGT